MTTVSVIMPCFNHARFVTESVEGILRQTLESLELIVVDDHSSDDSHERLLGLARSDRRVKVIRHDFNQGASSSRNDGLRHAIGDFVAFCDADDVWEPDKLATQLELLAGDHRYGMAYSDSIIIDENGVPTGQRFSEAHPLPKDASGNLFSALCVRNFINMQTVILRRASLPEGLLFDERIRWVEDWWYWIQLSAHCPFLYSPQPLAKYRTHSHSTNVTQRQGYHRNRFKVYKRTLKLYPDLPAVLTTRIWYHMACCLRGCGRHHSARTLFRQAFCVGMTRWESMPHSVRPLLRALWPAR